MGTLCGFDFVDFEKLCCFACILSLCLSLLSVLFRSVCLSLCCTMVPNYQRSLQALSSTAVKFIVNDYKAVY